MMYAMSIFSAKGQMTKELTTPNELILFYASEEAKSNIFKEHSVEDDSYLFTPYYNKNESFQFLPDYLNTENEVRPTEINIPKSDMRRRRMKPLQAPSIVIPFN